MWSASFQNHVQNEYCGDASQPENGQLYKVLSWEALVRQIKLMFEQAVIYSAPFLSSHISSMLACLQLAPLCYSLQYNCTNWLDSSHFSSIFFLLISHSLAFTLCATYGLHFFWVGVIGGRIDSMWIPSFVLSFSLISGVQVTQTCRLIFPSLFMDHRRWTFSCRLHRALVLLLPSWVGFEFHFK